MSLKWESFPDERTITYVLDIHVAKTCHALSEAVFYFMYRRCILCTLYGAVDFLIVLSKDLYGWGGGGRTREIKLLFAPAPPPPTVWALKHPSWAILHKTTYASMIYTSLCVMLLMRAASNTWASGRDALLIDAGQIKSITHGAV
jgi:hypothetical protein